MKRNSVLIFFIVIIAIALTACGIVSASEPAHTNSLDPENPDYENPDAVTFTVSFDSNGGTDVTDIAGVESGAKITAPTAPTWIYGSFVTWHKTEALNDDWDFAADTVTADTTLYAEWSELVVGDVGPGGGIIFYDDTIGFDFDEPSDGIQANEKNLFAGKSLDEKRYLEATDLLWGNLFAFATDARLAWADPVTDLSSISETSLTDSDSLAATVGTGLSSSTTVYNLLDGSQTNRAVQKCIDATIDGFADWFVPSVGEVYVMGKNKTEIGDFGATYFFWSSTKIGADANYVYDISVDNITNGDMIDGDTGAPEIYVRPIRAF